MAAYYNEIDPYAAEWLRNLISAGHIAPGDVDERDIRDVRPSDLRGYTQCHFFAGIGVWSYSLRLAGWPDNRPVWTGSCPCQPFSTAGRKGGVTDERHLWPQWHHLIRECRPSEVFGEQVASKDGLAWLDLVQDDMEGTGYAFGAVDTCSAGHGAPHIRQRLRFVAERVADTDDARLEGRSSAECRGERQNGQTAPHGSSSRMGYPGRATGERDAGAVLGTETREHGARGAVDGSEPDRFEHAGTGVGGGQPGPTNGFWRDADWLFCRDGKWRPVEPLPQPMVDGSTESLGRLLPGHLEEIEREVAEWAIRYQSDDGKAVHDLRLSLSARAKREWPVGRLPDIHDAPVLLAFMCQLREQGWAFSEGISRSSEEATQERLRMLWDYDEAARSSCERRLDEQHTEEPTDPLRVLSSILARHAQEAWGKAFRTYAATGFPLAHAATSRIGRLRAYGNAVDAQATKHFIEAYMECEADRDVAELVG